MLTAKSVGLWSADYTQVTGQALVTARVVQHQPQFAWREYVYTGSGFRSVISWAVAVLSLWAAVARGQITTLYLVCSRSHWGFLRDVPALLASMVGARVVVHAHGSDIVDLLASRPYSPLARALYRRCEIIVPSAHLLEPLRKIIKMPLYLCENYCMSVGVNISHKSTAVDEPQALMVLWNSNIMGSKGFFLLAEAVRRMSEEGHAVRLVSIGRPIGDDTLSEQGARDQLAALESESWFEYRGQLAPDSASAMILEADVVSLPSWYSSECQPLAIIQAMCAGRAMVVSDIPALRATLGEYPARFVPAGSTGAILDALRDLFREKLSDPVAFGTRRQAPALAAAKRFAVSRFDHEMATILWGGLENSKEAE
jgi:glycosyltransferase involved in cell wall biosynthesis